MPAKKKVDTTKYTDGNANIKVLATFELSGENTLVVREMPGRGANAESSIDVRTHTESEGFTGWTKKGIRLNKKQTAELVKVLGKVK